MKKAIYKVPNGKLLKIFLEEENGKINSVKITGDFFMYPEEHIENLEASFKGCELSASALELRLKEFLEKTPTNFFGLDNASLVSTILSAA